MVLFYNQNVISFSKFNDDNIKTDRNDVIMDIKYK